MIELIEESALYLGTGRSKNRRCSGPKRRNSRRFSMRSAERTHFITAYLDAACHILYQTGQPLRYEDITTRALAQ